MSDRHPLQPIFKVSTHEGLLAALIARRKQLGLSQLDIDMIGGLQSGYCGKIECGSKHVGYLSLTLLLGALRLESQAVPASGASKSLQTASPKSAIDPDNYVEAAKNFFAERGRKGARILNARLTAKQRRENGRKGRSQEVGELERGPRRAGREVGARS
jgi:hypothetical protein